MSSQSGMRRNGVRPAAAWSLLVTVGLLAGCSRSDQERVALALPAPTPPMAQETPPPSYPPELACKQIGGKVVLDVSLAANGLPNRVTVSQSSGTRTLDDLAVAAVREWKFKAATQGGKPAQSKLQVPVTFNPPNPPPDECNRYL